MLCYCGVTSERPHYPGHDPENGEAHLPSEVDPYIEWFETHMQACKDGCDVCSGPEDAQLLAEIEAAEAAAESLT